MKTLFLLSGLLICIAPAKSQKVIALHHAGQTSLFNTLNPVNDAVAASQSGDTIYIPGGGFTIGNLTIDKQLTIFGVGHYGDSTQATGITNLDGSIFLVNGADNSFLQGFYLSGNIVFGTSAGNEVVNNVTISRNNIYQIDLSYDGSDTSSATGIIIEENWIRSSINGGYTLNTLIQRNIIIGQISFFRSLLFRNNILMGDYCWTGPYRYLSNSLIRNNIHWIYAGCGNYFLTNCYSNSFDYNTFNYTYTWPNGSNTGSNNWYLTVPDSLLINCPSKSLNYSYDYHLQTPALFLGSDGTVIGIYGTSSPYKEGGVPKNPHIQSVSIADTTNGSGLLQIDIKVGAQNK